MVKIVSCCTIKPDSRLRLPWSGFLTDSIRCLCPVVYYSTPLHTGQIRGNMSMVKQLALRSVHKVFQL